MSLKNITFLDNKFYQNGIEGIVLEIKNGNFVKTWDLSGRISIKFDSCPEFIPYCF